MILIKNIQYLRHGSVTEFSVLPLDLSCGKTKQTSASALSFHRWNCKWSWGQLTAELFSVVKQPWFELALVLCQLVAISSFANGEYALQEWWMYSKVLREGSIGCLNHYRIYPFFLNNIFQVWVYPCLPWSLKRHGELVLQSTVWDIIVHSSVWLRICSWVNCCFFVLLLFLVHPEQLPPRPWITLKERDQILPSGKAVVLFPVFKQRCAEELFFGFFFKVVFWLTWIRCKTATCVNSY